MDIVNGTKGQLETFLFTGIDGARRAVVVVKRSYLFPEHERDIVRPARSTAPLLATDLLDMDGGCAVENEFVPPKGRCDVVVHGHASTPHGEPMTTLDVRCRVGSMDKTVRVIGDRVWERGLLGGYTPSAPQPFTRMSLGYARAFGGMHVLADDGSAMSVCAANPSGRGFGGSQVRMDGRPLPNLEAPDAPVVSPNGEHRPVALGPVPRSATMRARYAGTYDDRWRAEEFPDLPRDFDPRFWQCVAEDQQIAHPTGGEPVELHFLHADRPRIAFTLPRLEMPVLALFRGNRHADVRAVVDTLVLNVDQETVDVIWRADVPVSRSLREIDTLAAGRVCKRWWRGKVFAINGGCGCEGIDKDAAQMAPATRALLVLDDESSS